MVNVKLASTFRARSAGLLALLADPNVAEVYRDTKLHHHLAQSGLLIKSTDVLNQTGYNGANTMVVVLDSGVDYTLPDFGSCSAPGLPTNCRVKVAQDFATQDNNLDGNGHGTNVSGIVAGIASETQLAVFDVFDGADAYSSVVIQGINWAIANQVTYHISAINMSMGDLTKNTNLCSNRFSNDFVTPIASARSAGILTVISSGNSGFFDGLSAPACTPQAVSVGAVYDSYVGGLNWGVCTDNATAADKVACFSNSASYLSLLAPGALITAGGSTLGGTSQAAPHVAAAIAILRGARPTETVTSTLNL
jgi:subtilisin family serine protease